MTVVVDASVVTAALIDDGPIGRCCEDELLGDRLVGPELLPVEVMSVLRRTVTRGLVSDMEARIALDQLGRLPVQLWPFEPFVGRAWELRANVTSYDAWYVALAERLDATLLTLDRRLADSPGVRCPIVVPGNRRARTAASASAVTPPQYGRRHGDEEP